MEFFKQVYESVALSDREKYNRDFQQLGIAKKSPKGSFHQPLTDREKLDWWTKFPHRRPSQRAYIELKTRYQLLIEQSNIRETIRQARDTMKAVVFLYKYFNPQKASLYSRLRDGIELVPGDVSESIDILSVNEKYLEKEAAKWWNTTLQSKSFQVILVRNGGRHVESVTFVGAPMVSDIFAKMGIAHVAHTNFGLRIEWYLFSGDTNIIEIKLV